MIKNPHKLLKFISENIQYGYLGKDGRLYRIYDDDFNNKWYDNYILQNYNDVLKNKLGTCWNQVEFERKWFIEHNFKIKTFYEQVVLDYDNDYSTHTFLVYIEKQKWYYFENADFNNRGIYEFDSLDILLYHIRKIYIKLLKNQNIKDDEIDKIVIKEYTTPNTHISAKKFISHCLGDE